MPGGNETFALALSCAYASCVVDSKSPGAESPDAESLRLEVQEALITYRHHTSLVAQAFGFVIAADSALLAYGFAQKVSGTLLIASFMPIVMLLAYVAIMDGALAAAYAAIKLEEKLSLPKEGFAKLYFRIRDPSFLSKFLDMRIEELNKKLHSDNLKNPLSIMLCGVFVIQLCLFVLSIVIYHYRFM